MSLGERFPPELLGHQLVPGRVLHLYCGFAEKEKFVVLGSITPEPLLLVINSRVPQFVKKHPELVRCQVSIDKASHNFLAYDSVVACHNVERMGLIELHRQIEAEPSRIKEMVSDDVRSQIVAAVKHARTITPHDQQHLLQRLDV